MTKYLIFCGPGIGDFIIILPMVKSLKMYDPDSYIKIITTSSVSRIAITNNLCKLQHYIDDVDYYSMHEIAHTAKFMLKLGRKRFDYGFIMQYTDNEQTSLIPSKIVNFASKESVGIYSKVRKEIKYDVTVARASSFRVADYPGKMLKALNIPFTDDFSDLIDKKVLTKFTPAIYFDSNRKNIALSVGTANVSMRVNGTMLTKDSKHWFYESWIELANHLISQGYNVFLMGGPKEAKDLKEKNIELKGENIYNFTGKFSIIESIAVLNLCELVVGADTGLMHCAGALDKPSLTLFGCTDYHEYLPFGSNCQFITASVDCSPCFGTSKAVTCTDKKCMRAITVDVVMDRIHKLLKMN